VRCDGTSSILTALSVTFHVAAIAVLFWAAGWLGGSQSVGRLIWMLLVTVWPVTFVTTALNVAIAASTSAALDGRGVTVREALAVARGRMGQIALWALLATGLGALLQQLAGRRPFRGPATRRILGPPWGVVIFFAVPILALEGGTAVGCVARSSRLVRERWGEGVGGSVVTGAWSAAVAAVAGGLISVGVGIGGGAGAALLGPGVLVATAGGAWATSVHQVFAVALYRYGVTGEAAGGFAVADLQAPFGARWPARAART
jgi:hypothetical protein